jgi:hypothetical protein
MGVRRLRESRAENTKRQQRQKGAQQRGFRSLKTGFHMNSVG